ncbi:MAG: protocatechuate 3,4-dioxygenase subunit alpha [Pseudomonadota bacterium]|jgi:protocatechuate 3,4-dioxygenase alpha subunit
MSLAQTPSQTVGPYFQIGLAWAYRADLFPALPAHDARRIAVEGQLFDGEGAPIVDALLELWQADPEGRFATSADAADGLGGFGRVPTDGRGAFRFETLKPGRAPSGGGSPAHATGAPHINVVVSMRGLLRPVSTRIYFPDDLDHAHDPVLLRVPAERRHTLVAQPSSARTLRWDVRMQGADETVFFDY